MWTLEIISKHQRHSVLNYKSYLIIRFDLIINTICDYDISLENKYFYLSIIKKKVWQVDMIFWVKNLSNKFVMSNDY